MWIRLIGVLQFALVIVILAACGESEDVGADEAGTRDDAAAETRDAAAETRDAAAETRDAAAEAELIDDVQVVHVEATEIGFTPERIALEADIPVRMEFTRTAEASCITEVHIPELNVGKTTLPLNQAVSVEFTPLESGEYVFICGMDMLKGTLLVRVSRG